MTNQQKAEYPYMPNQLEVDNPIEGYSYSCIAAPGVHLEPLEPM